MVIQVCDNVYNHFLLSYILAQLNIKNRYELKHIAPESEDYKVEQVHFHWGHSNDNINGSEHTNEGQSYPLEVRNKKTIFSKFIYIFL